MATFKNSDSTGLWLHNKLGDEDLWSGISGICSHLGSKEVIQNVQACFMTLTPTVKLKLLMAFLHIPRRVVLEHKEDLEDILRLALHDTDQWVCMTADLLRTFPQNGQINLKVEEDHPALAEALQELRIKLSVTDSNALLPLECLYLNPNALTQLVGMQRPLVKHFALKRKPKSAALRAELLLKSSDAAKQQSKMGGTAPFKSRGITQRKTDDLTPLKGIPKNTPGFRSSNTTRRNTVPLNRNISRMSSGGKERGTKLLDITEQPIGGGPAAKRRKKQAEQEALEKAKKEKETAASTALAQPTPDYAASLLPPPATQTRQLGLVDSTTEDTASTAATPSYMPNINVARPAGQNAPLFSATLGTGPSQSFSLSARENLSQQLQQQLQPQYVSAYTQQQQPPPPQSQEALKQPSQPTPPPPYHQAGAPVVPTPQPQTSTAPAAPSTAPKKGLSLTREQMLAAQEMFRQSNKVTRPEKALILGFMAGSRENPCPQQGDSMTIKLSEETEMVAKTDGSGEEQLMTADTFFQMNYASGEWRRFKRYKPLQ